MLKIDQLYGILDNLAPFSISKKLIAQGDYDNSGVLVKCHEEVNKILFSLDLSVDCVKRAKRLGYDTIITHHPAIYAPISDMDYDGNNACVLLAVKNNINVISMHLNLDMAIGGIDQSLAQSMGANDCEILQPLEDGVGYGRKFCLEKDLTLSQLVKTLKTQLNTNKIVVYGSKNNKAYRVASFCGAGASTVAKIINDKLFDTQVIVTSDIPHHVIKQIIESGKAVIVLTHYSAENYGFKKFFSAMQIELNQLALTEYFEDKRFL